MERWSQIFHKLLFPRPWVMAVSVPAAAALLLYTFACGHEEEPAAYLSYVVSAYAMLIVCVRIPGLVRGGSALLHSNRYVHRYLTDIPFRMHVSLYLSLGINLLYAVMKLCLGAYYRSVWFGTFGVYYTLLTAMRFLLLRHVRRNGLGKDLVSELKRYRLCGGILVLMNIALSGVVVLVIRQNAGFEYAGYLIYIMAMYAFYAAITAVIDVVRYRKYNSPVMSAAKVIKLAAALVSMLALETAMLSQFGDGNDLALRQIMPGLTGAAVCVIVLGMGVYMIAHGQTRLRQLRPGR